ncbi:MAG: FKBP-type peptidyl-prolyl cis-trans isomerase N-terminal domain-containing protein [Sphaerochaetaceae bacterium]
MKKFSLFTALVLTLVLIASCTTTKGEKMEVIQPVTYTEATAETVVVSTPFEGEQLVIDTAPPITFEDADIDAEFSYVYGFLIGGNIMGEGLDVEIGSFVEGSNDFYNYVEPRMDENDIDKTFAMYQGYLDGDLVEDDLVAWGDFSSFFNQFSYGYGFVVQFNLQSQGLFLDADNFHNGLKDVFAGVPLDYTEEDIDRLFLAYQEKLFQQYFAMYEDYKELNLLDAEAFLAENALLEGVVVATSGLQYKVITEGDGPQVTAQSRAVVDYMISFLDGTIGENSYGMSEPELFTVSDLPPVIANAALLMREGSHYRFYVHPDLAYGEEGSDTVPPNSLLIVDVEVHQVLN